MKCFTHLIVCQLNWWLTCVHLTTPEAAETWNTSAHNRNIDDVVFGLFDSLLIWFDEQELHDDDAPPIITLLQTALCKSKVKQSNRPIRMKRGKFNLLTNITSFNNKIY